MTGSPEYMNKAIVRGTTVPTYYDAQEGYLQCNPRGDLILSQALPERAELNRLGCGIVISCTAQATLALGAIPTTTAPSYIWNGELGGGKIYIIDRINWVCTTSAAAATYFQICVCVGRASVTQPATIDTLTTMSTNGRKYGGRCGTGNQATVTNDGWYTIGTPSQTTLTATKGMAVEAQVYGSIIINPGCLLSLACLSVNGTSVGQFFITMYEVALTNIVS